MMWRKMVLRGRGGGGRGFVEDCSLREQGTFTAASVDNEKKRGEMVIARTIEIVFTLKFQLPVLIW